MFGLVWAAGFDDSGIERGAVYPLNGPGEVWNGLISVQESPSTSETEPRYRDGIKVGDRRIREDYVATIDAYAYPEIILERPEFGLVYRSGSTLHLIYNARAQLQEVAYQMPDPTPFTINLSARPIVVPGANRSAHLMVNAQAYPEAVSALEDVLYGYLDGNARLPLPEEVLDIFNKNALLQVINNDDGTWTATGPAEVIEMLDDTTFEISWPSVHVIDPVTYTIYSY